MKLRAKVRCGFNGGFCATMQTRAERPKCGGDEIQKLGIDGYSPHPALPKSFAGKIQRKWKTDLRDWLV